MYAEYLKERLNRELLLWPDQGFATYKIDGDDCYIVDIYVKKEFRRSGLANKLGDAIAKIAIEKGCKTLTGSVDLRANNPETSCMGLLMYGFKFHSALDHFIIYKKDL